MINRHPKGWLFFGLNMARYAMTFGAYEIDSVPGQPQIAHCHGFFIAHDQRGKGLAHQLKQDQNSQLRAECYDFATCTVDGANIAQQNVLNKAGWYKMSEFKNSKTGGVTFIYGYNVK